MIMEENIHTELCIFQDLPPEDEVCAPMQLEGGMNTGIIQTEEAEKVCRIGVEKNELLKNERV